MFSEEKLQQLRVVNEKLNLNVNDEYDRSKNIVFVYCPPKVGGTTLVSSIRIFAAYKYTVCHIHNEALIWSLTKESNISVMDVIRYNRHIGKNIWVIDVYRTPIERKISVFFEYICDLHFNDTEENISKYDLGRITQRFNNIFPSIANEDYFMHEYNIPAEGLPPAFDFHKKYIDFVDGTGIHYVKIRLQDTSTHWHTVLTDILKTDIHIVKDNVTQGKPVIGELYKRFIAYYKVPLNYWEQIQESREFLFYNDENERKVYLEKYKPSEKYIGYTDKEYELYKQISLENSNRYIVQQNHYMDEGCLCKVCKMKRRQCQDSIIRVGICDKIVHDNEIERYNKNKIEKLIQYNILRAQQQSTKGKKWLGGKKNKSMDQFGIKYGI